MNSEPMDRYNAYLDEMGFSALKMTDAQRVADMMFLETVERDYVRPLVEELKSQIPGFEKMGERERLINAVKLNEPFFGVGDSLPLLDALVYAGRPLGHNLTLFGGDVEVKQYQPRFKSSVLGRRTDFDINFEERMSDLKRFLTVEREEYESLPPAYRAALLYQHVESRVIASDRNIAHFVLGGFPADKMLTFRYDIAVTVGNSGLWNGYVVRIRDVRPSSNFGKALMGNINHMHDSLEKHGTPFFEQAEKDPKTKRRREPDPKTELVCRYIYEQEQQGVIIDKRRGGIGYKQLMIDMELNFGDKVRHYDNPDTLGRVYRAWKKKNGLT